MFTFFQASWICSFLQPFPNIFVSMNTPSVPAFSKHFKLYFCECCILENIHFHSDICETKMVCCKFRLRMLSYLTYFPWPAQPALHRKSTRQTSVLPPNLVGHADCALQFSRHLDWQCLWRWLPKRSYDGIFDARAESHIVIVSRLCHPQPHSRILLNFQWKATTLTALERGKIQAPTRPWISAVSGIT